MLPRSKVWPGHLGRIARHDRAWRLRVLECGAETGGIFPTSRAGHITIIHEILILQRRYSMSGPQIERDRSREHEREDMEHQSSSGAAARLPAVKGTIGGIGVWYPSTCSSPVSG